MVSLRRVVLARVVFARVGVGLLWLGWFVRLLVTVHRFAGAVGEVRYADFAMAGRAGERSWRPSG